ncbi:hypothetical protein [Paractinoplanes atraurantiacus]|uniref:hypothetical protein n=1 Tax=Paractinoplanes atraurantiacus TaxID=1036182 RepID=UPI001177D924|nr:hypothetical protein [Actinoplanes atraurantiacus]
MSSDEPAPDALSDYLREELRAANVDLAGRLRLIEQMLADLPGSTRDATNPRYSEPGPEKTDEGSSSLLDGGNDARKPSSGV